MILPLGRRWKLPEESGRHGRGGGAAANRCGLTPPVFACSVLLCSFPNYGNPIQTRLYYNPSYRDAPKSNLNFGKPALVAEQLFMIRIIKQPHCACRHESVSALDGPALRPHSHRLSPRRQNHQHVQFMSASTKEKGSLSYLIHLIPFLAPQNSPPPTPAAPVLNKTFPQVRTNI